MARRLVALVALTLVSLWSTVSIRPELLVNYRRYPALFIVPVTVAASLAAMRLYRLRDAWRQLLFRRRQLGLVEAVRFLMAR